MPNLGTGKLAIFSPPVYRPTRDLFSGKLMANCVATCVVIIECVMPFCSKYSFKARRSSRISSGMIYRDAPAARAVEKSLILASKPKLA